MYLSNNFQDNKLPVYKHVPSSPFWWVLTFSKDLLRDNKCFDVCAGRASTIWFMLIWGTYRRGEWSILRVGDVIGDGCMPEVDLDLVLVTCVAAWGVIVTSLVALGGAAFKTSTIVSSGLRCLTFLSAINFSATVRETRFIPRRRK